MKATHKSDALSVTVKIMGQEYSVKCPPAEHEALVGSAEALNERMSSIKRRGTALGTERIAVICALNLMHELLKNQGTVAVAQADQQALERVQRLVRDIDTALHDAETR